VLTNMYLKNFALIESANVEFNSNFNVLTGETGAGKSILIDAVGLVIGGRASTAFIRSGCDSCHITATFDIKNNDQALAKLGAMDIELEDDTLIIDRDISENGRSRSRINGQPVTLSILRDLGQYLIQIYGQHEHTLFLEEDYQRNVIDAWGKQEIKPQLEAIKRLLEQRNVCAKALASIGVDDQAIARELDILQFQVDEIEQAGVRENEDIELAQESQFLRNIEGIHSVLGEIEGLYEEIESQPALADKIGQSYRDLERVLGYDSRLQSIYDFVKNIYFNMQELSIEVYHYRSNLEYDPDRLGQIEERINVINSLKRKYGQSIEAFQSFVEEASARIYLLQNSAAQRLHLNDEINRLNAEYQEAAWRLTELRSRFSMDLCRAMVQALAGLGMEHVNLQCEVNHNEKLQSLTGSDEIDFKFSANLGEPLKSLKDVISGGELSRLMLVLKTLMVNDQENTAIIFDEVDVGIGGRVAVAVAQKIKEVSNNRQVLCVTHLPVIAAKAQHHYGIRKRIQKERTITTIDYLDQNSRLTEIVRMIGGDPTDLHTKALAQKLLAE